MEPLEHIDSEYLALMSRTTPPAGVNAAIAAKVNEVVDRVNDLMNLVLDAKSAKSDTVESLSAKVPVVSGSSSGGAMRRESP